jgi:hypothetical protein
MVADMHVPSNIATYRDDDGQPVFNTWFAVAEWGGSPALYAYASWDDRENAIDVAELAGVAIEAIGHRDAFLRIRGGARAWLHEMTIEGIAAFRPLSIQFPARIA